MTNTLNHHQVGQNNFAKSMKWVQPNVSEFAQAHFIYVSKFVLKLFITSICYLSNDAYGIS